MSTHDSQQNVKNRMQFTGGKIKKRVHIWAIQTTSYAGRVAVINFVIMGMFNFWATIFIPPQEVINEIKCAKIFFGG